MKLKMSLLIFFLTTQLFSQEKQLDIEGAMKIGHLEDDPAEDTEAGTIRWNPDTDDFEGWDGAEWKSLTQNTSSTWFPPATEHCQLVSSDGEANDRFGFAVDIFENTAIVGAHLHNTDGNLNRGKAYIFEREGDCWVEKSVLTSLDGDAGDDFGYDVAIFEEYAIVGAPEHDTNGVVDQGKAYIFVKPTGGWPSSMTQTTILLSDDGGVDNFFGESVAISEENAIVGARGFDNDKGHAYVFEKPSSGWPSVMTQSSRLIASDGSSSDRFGHSVSISEDVIVIGAYGFDSVKGKVYIFEKPDSGWPNEMMESATLITADGVQEDYFGIAVDIEGDLIVAGAFLVDVGNNVDQGKAYVFVKPTTGWSTNQTEVAQLIGNDHEENELFGTTVAISQNLILVAGRYHNTYGNGNQGKAYIFEEPPGGWSGLLTESASLIASDGVQSDNFGRGLGIYHDYIILGAQFHDSQGNSNQGKAYIFIKN